MEFFLYLTPVGQEILNAIVRKKFNIKENAAICRNKDLFGVVKTNSSEFIVCLDNIKNSISPVKHYVNETVYHEAVHVAQFCKRGKLGITASLSKNKMIDVQNSVKAVNSDADYEKEAYYLENKPEKVLRYLKKYCF